MKTVVLNEPGRLALVDTAEPAARQNAEAIVRVHRVGICGTDIHAYAGRQPFFTYPRILGHELGVEIIEVPANDFGLPVGDRCAVEPYLNCGECIACRHDRPNCCVKLEVLGVHIDGGMREQISVPLRKLHRSTKLPLESLALVETLGIGAHAVQRAQLAKDEWALVVGAGPIGLSVIQFAKLAGARLIVLDVNPQRLDFCRNHFQPEQALAVSDGITERLRTLTNGDLPTAVFDATGHPASMARSFEFVAHGGRLVMVGLVQGNIAFDDPGFHRRELTVLASRNALPDDFRRIIAWTEEGRIDPTVWITHRAKAEQLIDIFPRWIEPGSGLVKAIVDF